MRYLIQIALLALTILNISTLCNSNLLSDIFAPLTCKSENIPLSLSPFDLEELISFFNSQRTDLEELITMLSTEKKDFEASFLEAAESDEDINLNITELIEKYGFQAEVHNVTTDDGYVLTMQRIVGDGPVVFLMHGLLSSADDFVTPGPDEGLALLFAAEGYDVWLGNNRGNKHSSKHVTLSPKCGEFWQYSFNEIGEHDLPAMIDYALNTTGKTNLTYVGHSQGTTDLLVLCSEFPEYNKKISLAVLLAPICFMSHLKSPLPRILALDANYLIKIGTLFGLNEVLPNNILLSSVIKLFCGNNPLGKYVCGSLLNLIGGFDTGLLNVKRLPVILGHQPAGSSVMQLGHYGQEILSGKFRKFDFKKSKNLEVYGSEDPPEYSLDKITVPIGYVYGGNDWFANVTDVQQLHKSLPNVVKTKFLEKYNHLDMIWAKNLNEDIFKPILGWIKEFQD